jgi:PAS domain S-box-containing protein
LNCTLLLGDGTVLWANQTELNVLGYTAEEYIGKQIMNFCPDERELVLEIFKRLGTGNIIKDVPVRFRTKDGRLVHLLIDSNVAYNRDGSFGHTRCFIRDDTGRKIRDVRTKLLIDENERVCCDNVLRIVTMRISNYPSFLLCAELEDA